VARRQARGKRLPAARRLGQTGPRAPSQITTSTTRHFTGFDCILKVFGLVFAN